MSSLYISIIIVWPLLGLAMFWILRGPTEMLVDDLVIEGRSETIMQAIILALTVAAWPLIVFGYGCGMGFTKYMKNNEAKVTSTIMTMVERSNADSPMTSEDWRNWFAEHIHRMPRSFLYKLMVFDVGYCELEKEEINKIVSSEIADRDLFGNKR